MNASKNELKLTPSDSVRAVQNQDGAVLLDIRQGLCLSMSCSAVCAERNRDIMPTSLLK